MNRDPREEMEALRAEIKRHEQLYYVHDAPEISDEKFDAMMRRLRELETKYPLYVSGDSPTLHVGGERVNTFAPVPHRIPMLSLENTYSKAEFLDWYNKTKKALNGLSFPLVVETKVDGLSCSIEYENGILTRASTRGDGNTGEDVTLNVCAIKNIPHKLKTTNPPRFFEVRGEVYMDRKDFETLREEAIANGEEPFVNARNAASGSLRQKNPKITESRRLKFFAHSYGYIEGLTEPRSHSEYLELCRSFGFETTILSEKPCYTPEEVEKIYDSFETARFTNAFDADGLVVKIDLLSQRAYLGATAKSPRWALALKYPAQKVETKLIDVIFSVGRTGVVTPVAMLEPVKCAGVTISSATLHNFDELRRLDLKLGDRVIIERAGEVIPKVVKVVFEARRGSEKNILPPQSCPSCGGDLFRTEAQVALRCVNPSCPAQFERALLHFTSKNAMNIEGFGEAVVAQVVAKNFVKNFANLYTLSLEQLSQLELFGLKRANNLLKEIEKSKHQPLSRLIFALGIRHVGEKNAKILAANYKTMQALLQASAEEISMLPDIGSIIARSVKEFFSEASTCKLIRELEVLGINMTEPENILGAALAGKTFVFTGELSSMSRAEAAALVMSLGGKDTSSVSAKTSYVVVGANAGSKYDKALKLGIKILKEAEFLALCGK